MYIVKFVLAQDYTESFDHVYILTPNGKFTHSDGASGEYLHTSVLLSQVLYECSMIQRSVGSQILKVLEKKYNNMQPNQSDLMLRLQHLLFYSFDICLQEK